MGLSHSTQPSSRLLDVRPCKLGPQPPFPAYGWGFRLTDLVWQTNTMSWRGSRTPIRGDGDGRFIGTASHYPPACEVAVIRLKAGPKELGLGPVVSSWLLSIESKMANLGPMRPPTEGGLIHPRRTTPPQRRKKPKLCQAVISALETCLWTQNSFTNKTVSAPL
jgi:hypothetical protein